MRIDEGVVTPRKVTQTPAPTPFISPEQQYQSPISQGIITEVTPPVVQVVTPSAPTPFISPEQQYQSPISQGIITEVTPPDPAPPSIWQQILHIGSDIISPIISVAKAVADPVIGELEQVVSRLNIWARSAFADVYTFFDNAITAAKNDVGTWVKDAKNAGVTLFDDAKHYAGHLYDVISTKVDLLAKTVTDDAKTLEDTLSADIKSVEEKISPAVHSIITDVIKPIEGFVSNAEGWAKAQWDLYSQDVTSFVGSADHWLAHKLDEATAGIRPLLDNPVGWLESNFTRLLGDYVKWLEPGPVRFLNLLPDVLGWFEFLASNPINTIKEVGRALTNPSNYKQAHESIAANKYTIASDAVRKWRDSR